MKIFKVILVLAVVGISIFFLAPLYWLMIRFMLGFGLAIVVTGIIMVVLIFGISGLIKSIFPDFWKRMEEKQRQKNLINFR